MLKASIVPWLLVQAQLISMLADVCTTLRTFVVHWRETKEAWKLVIWRWLKRLFLAVKRDALVLTCLLIFVLLFEGIIRIRLVIVRDPTACLGQAAPAANGDI
ncbi:hypothetical protein MTO96_017021 [Rhipicephalus appendiculatus]